MTESERMVQDRAIALHLRQLAPFLGIAPNTIQCIQGVVARLLERCSDVERLQRELEDTRKRLVDLKHPAPQTLELDLEEDPDTFSYSVPGMVGVRASKVPFRDIVIKVHERCPCCGQSKADEACVGCGWPDCNPDCPNNGRATSG